MDYPITLEHESPGRVRIEFPDFPGTSAVGFNEADGLIQARKALAVAVGTHIRARRPVPSPSRITSHFVTLPALIEVKIRLYDAMRAAAVGKAELARRLQWHMPQVDRLLDVAHGSRLEQLEAAFAALGKRLAVDVLDEAPESTRPGPRATPAPTSERPAPAGPAAFEVQWD